MDNYAIGIGTQGFSGQYNVQNQLSANNTENQIGADNTLNKYDNLLLWQASTQSAIDESVYIEMASQPELAGTDEWDIKYAETEQKYYEIARETSSYTFVEEGEEYGDSLETLAQERIEAYDIIEADGKVTFEEYKQSEILEYNTFLPKGDTPLTEDNEEITQLYEKSFNFMDLNGNNTLDKDEIKAYYLLMDTYDTIGNLPENPADAMDGNIKFSSIQDLGDIISTDAQEGSQEAEERAALREILIETYNTIAKEPITPAGQDKTSGLPPMPEKCGEPTALGKTIIAIEKNISINPFEQKT